MTVEEHLTAISAEIDELGSKHDAALEQYTEIQTMVSKAQDDLSAANTRLAKRQSEVELETRELSDRIDTLKADISELEITQQALIDKNASLKIDNARLESDNKAYREYEAQATKVLDARDKSLQARIKEVAETEILLANRASLLPKR